MQKETEQVCEIQLKPHERSRISLGEFDLDNTFKGLSIEFAPDPDPDDSIVAHIVQVGPEQQTNKYTLLLHIANHGSKTVKATVSQI